MDQSIFQNNDARHRLENWYVKFLERANVTTESRYVDTSHGKSHVLLAGDKSNPPLVCLHGSLTSSAHLLSELRLLTEHFYIIAPDLPGQSVRGVEKHLPLNNDSLSSWLIEVLDHLI